AAEDLDRLDVGLRERVERGAEAHRAQGLDTARHEPLASELACEVGLPLEERHADAAAGEEVGERGAGRAGADDHRVGHGRDLAPCARRCQELRLDAARPAREGRGIARRSIQERLARLDWEAIDTLDLRPRGVLGVHACTHRRGIGMGPEGSFWKRCSTCKKELPFVSTYWACNVSTCNRPRTALAFCSVACWDAHVPMLRH